MKKFRFNLENVLKLRESHEKVAQRKVQEVQEELNQVERKIEELRNESDALQKVQPGRNKGSSTSGAEMRAYFEYYQFLGDAIADQQDEAMRVNNVLAQKREHLNAARRDKKAIERLKEKRFEEWKEEGKKKEAKLLDEFAVLRHPSKPQE